MKWLYFQMHTDLNQYASALRIKTHWELDLSNRLTIECD